MLQNASRVHLRLGGCHAQTPTGGAQFLQRFRDAGVHGVFKNACRGKVFPVVSQCAARLVP